MREIQTICQVLLTLLTGLYAYLLIYIVIGFFHTKRFPKATKLHRYGIVIAARNEAAVISNLLDSIQSQKYPSSLITAFVVADNCTDDTADIARRHGAICYERTDPSHQTKGYALQFLFEQIRRDYGIRHFDGYIILDADNILKSDYIEKMNNAFDSGEKIITSYRNTRNLNSGWIAASYAIHWMRTIRLEHRARSLVRLAGRLQGTGMLFASELVKEGWNYTMLTEDRSFCADAVIQGYSISYQDEAEFYDEQPTRLRIALRQRIRWSKGHLQAFACYSPSLFRKIFTAKTVKQHFMSFDMLLIVFPRSLARVILSLISLLMGILIWFDCPSQNMQPEQISSILAACVLSLFLSWLKQTILAAYVLFMERRHLAPISLPKKLWYCMTFFMFDLIGAVSVCIAAVSHVEWKPIPHYGQAAMR